MATFRTTAFTFSSDTTFEKLGSGAALQTLGRCHTITITHSGKKVGLLQCAASLWRRQP